MPASTRSANRGFRPSGNTSELEQHTQCANPGHRSSIQKFHYFGVRDIPYPNLQWIAELLLQLSCHTSICAPQHDGEGWLARGRIVNILRISLPTECELFCGGDLRKSRAGRHRIVRDFAVERAMLEQPSPLRLLAYRLRRQQLAFHGWFNALFWRKVDSGQVCCSYLIERTHNAFAGLTCPDGDLEMQDSLRCWNLGKGTDPFMRHNEYVLQIKQPVIIEPRSGWAIVGQRQVFAGSVPYDYCYPLPRLHALWSARRVRPTLFPAVVSLRSGDGGNYFHCFCDVLTKLSLLQSAGIPEHLPLVISRRLYRMDFFQAILRRTTLGNRTWIVQGPGDYVHAAGAYCLKPLPIDRSHIDRVLEWIQPPAPTGNNRRLFVNRSSKAGRGFANIDELRPILRRYGFEEIDTGQMSLDEQMQAFADARYVVGLHGAGLTNLLFRRGQPLALLEVFPPEIFPPFKAAPHYFWLCAQYGYAYDALRGEPAGSLHDRLFDSRMLNFVVKPKVLQSRICRMLGNAGSLG